MFYFYACLLSLAGTPKRRNESNRHSIINSYMPKFPKGFGRQKSSANVFDDVEDSPVVGHSFKVFERSDGASKSFDGGVKLAKPVLVTPAGRSRTAHKTEESMFEHLYNNNR